MGSKCGPTYQRLQMTGVRGEAGERSYPDSQKLTQAGDRRPPTQQVWMDREVETRSEWQQGLGQISSPRRHPKPEIPPAHPVVRGLP